MTNMLVREVMMDKPPTIHPDTSVDDAVDALFRHQLMGLPVIDAHHQVVGFLSEQDCMHAMMVSSYHCEKSPDVQEVMSKEVVTISPEESILDIAQRMGKDRPKSYPVVSNGKLVGLLTRRAILHALWENHASCNMV